MTLRTPKQMEMAAISSEIICKVRKEGDTSLGSAKCWRTYTKQYVELGDTCDKDGCTNPPHSRISINCHGIVYEVDVCQDHTKPDGAWVDSL